VRPIDLARVTLATWTPMVLRVNSGPSPCRLPGTGSGARCRFHGGRSPGRPVTHGRSTKKAKLERGWARLLVGALAQMYGGHLRWFRPRRMSPERVAEVLAQKVKNRPKT